MAVTSSTAPLSAQTSVLQELPSKEVLREIAAKQDAKQKEIQSHKPSQKVDEQREAAEMIQRNYRGYRERRRLQGFGLDPQTRWIEAVKEAQYKSLTKPVSRRHRSSLGATSPDSRQNWKRARLIARRAGSDDTSDTEDDEGMDEEQRKIYQRKTRAAKAEQEKTARMMGLEYFLEMVDQKHRYGSNLRAYHAIWKESETNENFFYWLDYGEGKAVDLHEQGRSRKRLDEEQVRYLSREERQRYLVKIDQEGRLCWAKNGIRISTNTDWKDSIDGIVPQDDKTPTFRDTTLQRTASGTSSDSSSSSDSDNSASSGEDASRYVNQELHDAKGVSKIKHISPGTVLNHTLRKTTKKNTWIFVADTSFRLYIGIKQSGAFQHSSFLHGARISTAGLLKIKDGQLRRLSPLSGHYQPPAASFRLFVKSLKDAGVDMSRVSISRSYAVIVGLEGYVRARKKIKHGIRQIGHHKDRVLHPEEVRRREEEAMDKSQSAEKERRILAEKKRREEEAKTEGSLKTKLMRKLHLGGESPKTSTDQTPKDVKSAPGEI